MQDLLIISLSLEVPCVVELGFELGIGEESVSGMSDFPASASDVQHESFMNVITVAVAG